MNTTDRSPRRASSRLQPTLLAGSLFALCAFWATPVLALSLGNIAVQSALGEPLRAEIPIISISDEEAASLRVNLAPPAIFRATGLDYNRDLSSLTVQLKRTGKNAYLELRTGQSLRAPFVDLILQAQWAKGRILRSYTILLDPPSTAQPAQVTSPSLPIDTSASSVSAAPSAPPVAAPELASPAPKPAPAPSPAPQPVASPAPKPYVAPQPVAAPAPKPAPAPAPKPVAKSVVPKPAVPKSSPSADATPKPALEPQDRKTVEVKPGDTLGEIAMTQKMRTISLDQMLIALLRGNPDAFIENNVNLVKAGEVLRVPTQEEAAQLSADQAREMVRLQTKDFHVYRERLVASAAHAKVEAASRQASGKVSVQVNDGGAAPAVVDKLTLSKDAANSQAQEQLAQQKNAKEASDRAAELTKNINDLDQLSKSAAVATTATDAAKSTGADVAEAGTLPQPTPLPNLKPSGMNELVASPRLLWGGAALLALLALWAWLRIRQRRREAAFDDEAHAQTFENFEANDSAAPDDGQGRQDHDLAHPFESEPGLDSKNTDLSRPPAFMQATPGSTLQSTWHQDLNLKEKKPWAPTAAAPHQTTQPRDASPPSSMVPDSAAAQRSESAPGADFDFSTVSLELEPSSDTAAASRDSSESHKPWLTKIALAAEFKAMGDLQGARVLLEEVVAQAPQEIRAQAQAALAQL